MMKARIENRESRMVGRDSVEPLRLLDLFCGVGGWSKGFLSLGWQCTGVDRCNLGYPGEFVLADVRELARDYIDSFDAVVASSPCEEFARAWLPWLRCDKTPTAEAIALLELSVEIVTAKPNRIAECSKFAARHVSGATLLDNRYALWGDVPAILPAVATRKSRMNGRNPAQRAEIPPELSMWIATVFTSAIANRKSQIANS
jgi:hypothetical protein